jgi:hypothetical protein
MMNSVADMMFHIALARGRYTDPLSLARFQTQVYSQNGEDGIIAEIFHRIGNQQKFFVEIGVEEGVQNNTRFLLEQGWRGVWVEAAPEKAEKAEMVFRYFVEQGALIIIPRPATVESINEILDAAGVPAKIDLLSVDCDQNTSHVWRAIDRPARAACIEYNASIPASLRCEVPYDPQVQWNGTNWFGASLKTLEEIGDAKGLSLVGCDLVGVNAFFVSSEEAEGRFQKPYTAEEHYEPLRLSFVQNWGHPPSSSAQSWTTGEQDRCSRLGPQGS